MLDPTGLSWIAVTGDRPRTTRRRWSTARPLAVGLALAVALVLGACAVPFGNGTDPSSQPPEETRRDRNRLYLEEQERIERQRTFDRVGPSDR